MYVLPRTLGAGSVVNWKTADTAKGIAVMAANPKTHFSHNFQLWACKKITI